MVLTARACRENRRRNTDPKAAQGQGKHKPDEGQQQGKEEQNHRLSAVVGEDIGLMEHDAV